MAGISDKAIETQYTGNKYRYNTKELQSQEFNDGSGLELYDFSARMQDPQIGRFLMIDPSASKYSFVSPYAYVLNDPIRGSDPTGMDTYLSGGETTITNSRTSRSR
jgi:RHS repeat-associated protein